MLIYNRRGAPTGRVIAESLGMNNGGGIPLGLDPDDNILIRWGNSLEPEIDESFDRVINSAESIQNATNKLLSLEIMRDSGLNVPFWSEDAEEVIEECGYPILGRRLRHARGSDIQLILQKRDMRRPRDFYTAYIPTNREYRVHVVGEEAVRVQAKYLDFPEQKKAWIRNYSSGYRFRNPRLRMHSRRLQAAISAVSILGLDFGAVDLIVGDDNETYILEVNTAPSCSPLTGAAYVNGIANLFEPGEIIVNMEPLQLLVSDDEDGDTEDIDDSDVDEYVREMAQQAITG
jgi:hypothetical protein